MLEFKDWGMKKKRGKKKRIGGQKTKKELPYLRLRMRPRENRELVSKYGKRVFVRSREFMHGERIKKKGWW